MAEALDLPAEAVSGMPKLTLQGREAMLVETTKASLNAVKTLCGCTRLAVSSGSRERGLRFLSFQPSVCMLRESCAAQNTSRK